MRNRWMTRALWIVLPVMTIVVIAAHVGGPADAAGTPSLAADACDYGCLTAIVDQYLKALVAHDPGQIPVVSSVKFTENTIPLKLGDALWGTMSGLGTYKLYFADPQDGTAGIEASIRENGLPPAILLTPVEGGATQDQARSRCWSSPECAGRCRSGEIRPLRMRSGRNLSNRRTRFAAKKW